MGELNNPHRRGTLEAANARCQAGTPEHCPWIRIRLKLVEEQIVAASIDTYGCPVATATASWVTRWVEGKTIEQASVLDPGMLMTVLGGLPLAKEHTAYLAVKALQMALQQVGQPDGGREREGAHT